MENDKLVEELVALNPDQQAPVKYIWDEDFQRILIGMLLCNRFFLYQSLGLVKVSYFQNEIHQLICRILFDYFNKYKQLPSKVWMRQGVTDVLREKYQHQNNETFQTAKLIHIAELNTVYDYYSRGGVGDMMPDLDSPESLLDEIARFAKAQAVKFAFFKCLDIIRKNPKSDDIWNTVDEIIKEARLVDRQTDLGLDYFGTIEERYYRMANAADNTDVFTTGFDTLDNSLHGNGLCRGELAAWMAKSGGGKSIALVIASVKNLAKGKKVLYVSTEMDNDRIAARFDSQFSLVGQHELIARKEEVWDALNDEIKDYDDKKRLIIKQFPSGTADVNTIRAFHSQCVMNGFKPDLVIVDYPGDMKHSSTMPLHQSMQLMLTNLRGFGGEEGHLTMVAVQPNRGPNEQKIEDHMDESRQGDSYGQNRVLDAFWTLNQTAQEQKAEVGRVFVAKARNGKSRFGFKVHFGFKSQTLVIDEISDSRYADLMNRVKETDADEVAIDNVVVKKFEPTDGERVN